MQLQLDKPIVFFDIESTGTNVATDRIVELAILKIHPDQVKENRVYLFNPGCPIPAEAAAVHGITDADVANAPYFKDKANEIVNYIGDADMAGYNSNRFDVPLLVEECMRAGVLLDTKHRRFIDVYKIFAAMERRDLASAYQFYCGKDLTNAHRAEADITATYEVLLGQLERYDDLQNNMDALHEISKDGDFVDLGRRMLYVNGEPTFNFGKYKGHRVVDVLRKEPQYYDWILRSDFLYDTKQKLKEIKLTMMMNQR